MREAEGLEQGARKAPFSFAQRIFAWPNFRLSVARLWIFPNER
jgi:hypothetical protein